MNFKLLINEQNGKSFFGDEKALSVQKNGKGDFSCVYANVEIANGFLRADSALVCFISGLPAGKYVCDYMITTCWSAPFFGADVTLVPKGTQAILMQDKDEFLFILPLVGESYRTYLVGSNEGLSAVTYSLSETLNECKQPLFIYGRGKNAYRLLEDGYRYAASILGGRLALRQEREYPKKLEYLGWCSWDALHVHVSEDGVLQKCQELKQKGVPVKWVMLDDMWADCPHLNEIPEDIAFWDMVKEMHQTPLRSFEADSIRFPNGLKGCIDKISQLGFETGIWFPATGYWKGFEKDGDLVKNNAESFISTKDGVTLIAPQKQHFEKIYGLFSAYVRESGGTFIKVDRQSCLGMYAGIGTIGENARALQSSVDELAVRDFDGNIINCMGMSSENMFNREKTAIIRCSDDFMPNDGAWFKKHVNHCAYNTLFWGNVYYTDWDMFWTGDKQALKNAILHALSGGPIYVSDKIGETQAELLFKLCEKDGRIIRAEQTLVPVQENLFTDAAKEETAISLFNRKNGAIAIASFNVCDGKSVRQEISLQQFNFASEEVCVYDWFKKTAKFYRASETLPICLSSPDEIGLYIVATVENGFAVIGDTEKFLSSHSVLDRTKNDVLIKGGTCLIASQKALNIDGALQLERTGNLYLCVADETTRLKVQEK